MSIKHRKKFISKIFKVSSLMVILLMIQNDVAFAKAFGFSGGAGNIAAECALLNTPQEIDNIITIIEEPLSGGEGRGYATCMRRTCCETAEGNCKSIISDYTPPPKPATTATETQAVYKKCYSDYAVVGDCQPGTDEGKTVSCKRIGIFFGGSGSELLYSYIGAIYRYVASTGGIACVFIIVWNGFNIATAGDQTQKIEDGKKKIMQSLYGLALLFMSAVILYTINPNFFVI